MALLIDAASWLMLTLGGALVLTGGIGALRMPTLYLRVHGSSLTDSLAPILVLGGVMLQAGWSLATAKLAAILLVMLITGPTASYALANAALLAGMPTRTDDDEGR